VACVTNDSVCAEKLRKMGKTPRPPSSTEGSRAFNWDWTMTVLPVPVTPVTKTGLSMTISVRIKNENRVVSSVGTTMAVYWALLSKAKFGTIFFQASNLPPGLSPAFVETK